uniref:Capsule gland specific secretory protein n=1 Tax=Reishia bronni TaxID=578817 RepID=A0A6G9KRJ6_9CAEN|nr:capsule gland specific secretory protein [Reishia bronni]
MWLPWRALLAVCLLLCHVQVASPGHQHCHNMEPVMYGPPDLVMSRTTGAIKFKPLPLIQEHRKICEETKSNRRYRTADGTCNHAFNLGAANTPLNRMLPPEYDDLNNSPRKKGVHGFELPAPTDISRLMHRPQNDFDGRTVLLMQWGQFIDHDFAQSPVEVPEGLKEGDPYCCLPNVKDREGVCMPIYLHQGDTRFRHTCMEFMRSVPAKNQHGYNIFPREQINVLTSFIDGSPIYGSNLEVQKKVRCLQQSKSAFLKMNSTTGLLPESDEGDCMHEPGQYCFLAGDRRVNEQPGLGVLHTLLNKLHNRIASKLKDKLRNADPEIVFQETRKVVIAIIQNIHYGEWLPQILSDSVMRKYDLHTGRRVAYSGSVDPRILNSFSTAAFRFGHSLIPEHYVVNGKAVRLRKTFNNPALVFDNFKGMLKALMEPGAESQKIDSHIVEEVTRHLFEPEDQVENAPSRGLDLVAFNIQRGRDHGLPPYNKYRQHCGLPPITDFYNFTANSSVGQQLSSLYNSVDDIDLFTGALLEDPEEFGKVGPTFGCIMAVQFHALKFGDRFYFETCRHLEGFTDGQLASLRKVTMAHVMCFFSEQPLFDSLQERCFESPSRINRNVDCGRLRRHFLDWSQWEEVYSPNPKPSTNLFPWDFTDWGF